MVFNYVVYKITFPNGKIYVGKDEGGLGHSLSYFGSWDANLVEQDFSAEQNATGLDVVFRADGRHDPLGGADGVADEQAEDDRRKGADEEHES